MSKSVDDLRHERYKGIISPYVGPIPKDWRPRRGDLAPWEQASFIPAAVVPVSYLGAYGHR